MPKPPPSSSPKAPLVSANIVTVMHEMKDSSFTHHFCAVVLGVLRSVAPLSFALVGFRAWAFVTGRRQSLLFSRTTAARRLLNVWLVCEALFWLYCRVHLERAQGQPPPERVIVLSPEQRRVLLRRCLATSASAEAFAEGWLQSRHSFAELKRDNVREWLAWGLFHVHAVANLSPAQAAELEGLISLFETQLAPGARIPEGYNPSARLFKFSAEPVTYSHRPLALYAVIHFVLQEVVAPTWMGRCDFTRHTQGGLVFWYRPGRGPASLAPLVFVHGLGIGVMPYKAVIASFCNLADDQRPLQPGRGDGTCSGLAGRALIVVELQAVSMRLAPPELHRDDFVADMRQALARFGHVQGAVFAGHSYGSFTLAWLVHRAADLVRGLVLLDPACLLLHLPSVLTNILYRGASNSFERFLNYLIREELFFNAHARRWFFWYANALFLEDVDTAEVPTMVLLSEQDEIIPVKATRAYVLGYNAGARLDAPVSAGAPVDLLYLERTVHGGFLSTTEQVGLVVKRIDALCARCG
jgi:pimeloyl-ACP methyl ester carboxylesterase